METTTDEGRIEAQAPGCFASPSVFSVDSKICNVCVAFNPCRSASYERLEKIKGLIDVQDILARHAKARVKAHYEADEAIHKARQTLAWATSGSIAQPAPITAPVPRNTAVERVEFDITPQEEARIQSMPGKKAQALTRILLKKNIMNGILPALRQGSNPFANIPTWPYLKVACDMLLEGLITKHELARRLKRECGKDKPWTQETAESHRAMVMSMLCVWGAVVESNGVFTINRHQGNQ